jgi:hypothetical protein
MRREGTERGVLILQNEKRKDSHIVILGPWIALQRPGYWNRPFGYGAWTHSELHKSWAVGLYSSIGKAQVSILSGPQCLRSNATSGTQQSKAAVFISTATFPLFTLEPPVTTSIREEEVPHGHL